ncbi:MAG: T9SS type A sorting domain-containing protein [Saprospiraceae bacterium]|nr:T9SS type A sorting domain-containing protein [Saprospiraceae bacterium]MBK9631409.1 T9SS type A sorting domain-containing protein [Saprospiraceae bacterium]
MNTFDLKNLFILFAIGNLRAFKVLKIFLMMSIASTIDLSAQCTSLFLNSVNVQDPDIGNCSISLALKPQKSNSICKRVDYKFYNIFWEKFEVNFDDGQGYIIIKNDQVKSITYATYGNKKIRARGTSLGSYAECEFDMLIKTQPGNEHFNYIQPDMSIPLKVEDFQPPLNGYYSVDEYDGKPHGGCATAHIRFANKQLQYDIPISQNKLPYLCNPVIFVEGLDLSPYPICNPDNGKPIRYGDFGWDIFTLGTSENSPHTGTGSFDQMKLLPEQLKKFQESGRDIILLDFCDGADYIQLNSLLLQKLIIEVNKMKLGCSNPSPNTVIGASMGGMVSRHALSSMEKSNVCHDTKFYVSFDAPHKGANISLGLQATAWFASKVQPNDKDIQNLWKALHRPAPRQLLTSTLESEIANGNLTLDNWGVNTNQLEFSSNQGLALRNQFENELKELGFPETTINLAIADGSEVAKNQGYTLPNRLFRAVLSADNWAFKGSMFQIGFSAVDGESWDSRYDYKCQCIGSDHNSKNQGNVIFSGFSPELPLEHLAGCNKTVPCKMLASNFIANEAILKMDHVSGGKRIGDLSNIIGIVSKVFHNFKQEYGDLDCIIDAVNNDNICFIPTMSALDIDWELNNENLSKNIKEAIIVENGLTPFDAYYAPNKERDNEENFQHVELTQGMMDWLDDQMKNPVQKKLLGLPKIPEGYQSYNYGYNRKTLPSIKVNSGTILSVNDCGATGYRNEPESASEVFEVYTECNAYVDIFDGATIQLGNEQCAKNGIVFLKEGSTLHLHSGATLEINGELSKLVIETGSNLILEEGAIVKMRDARHADGEAQILIKGHIHWGGDISFSGNGHFRFVPTHSLSIATSLNLTGINMEIRFIHLIGGTVLETGDHVVSLNNGKIFYEDNSKIRNSYKCNFNSLKLTSPHFVQNKNAIAIEMDDYETLSMSACVISKIKQGVNAIGRYKTEEVSVSNSTFYSEIGIKSVDTRYIKVDDCVFSPINFDNIALDCQNNTRILINEVNASNYYLSAGTFFPRSSAMKFVNSGNVYMTSTHVKNNHWGIYCPEKDNLGNKAKTNIKLYDCYIDNNIIGIEMYGGSPSGSIVKWGLLDISCSSVSHNNIGVKGQDIDLFIDNNLKSRNQVKNRFVTSSGRFGINPIFEIQYIQRSPGIILARENYWGGIIPQPGLHYRITGASLNPIPVNINQFTACNNNSPGDMDRLIDDDDCIIQLNHSALTYNLEEKFSEAYNFFATGQFHLGELAMASVAEDKLIHATSLEAGCKEMADFSEHFGLPGGPEMEERNKSNYSGDFEIYPNPTKDNIIIRHNKEKLNLTISNQFNQVVIIKQLLGQEIIDLSHLPPGLYFVESNEFNGIIRKFVKIK